VSQLNPNRSSVPEDAFVKLDAEVKIRRILFFILFILFVTVIAIVVLLGVMNQKSIISSSLEQQSTLAEFAGRNIELGLVTGEMEAVKGTLNRLQEYSIFKGAVLYDAEGDKQVRAIPPKFSLPSTVVPKQTKPVTEGDVTYQSRKLKDQSGTVSGYLVIAFDVSPVLSKSRWTLIYACGIGLLILVPVMVFAAWRTIRLLKPIGLLERVLESVSAGDLTQKLDVTSKGVVGRIATA